MFLKLFLCSFLAIYSAIKINRFSVENNLFSLTNQHRANAKLHFHLSGVNVTGSHYLKNDTSEVIFELDNGETVQVGELNYDRAWTEYMLVWKKTGPSLEKELCFHYGRGNASWFSSYEEKLQRWPLDTGHTVPKGTSFTTADFFGSPNTGSFLEYVFLNSDGFAIVLNQFHPWFIRRDPNEGGNPLLCFSTSIQAPYPKQESYSNPGFFQTYIHLYAVDNLTTAWDLIHHTHIYPPKAIPDERMFRQPIWSTWAQFKQQISQEKVLAYANQIVQHGFTQNAQLEIDDRWETHYGDLAFDLTAFPDPKKMIQELKRLGFRVTVWVTPFITQESSAFNSSIPYLVTDSAGHPVRSKWNSAGIVDFSNAEAVKWWVKRLSAFRVEYSVDSFKFDDGEVAWYPEDFQMSDPKVRENVNWVSSRYVEAAAQLGPMVEVRTAFKNQDQAVFLRLMDRESDWTLEDGLGTLIPTALTAALAGYDFLIPDMIGGNANPVPPSEELYIRWVQACTFLPSMQLSVPPWSYSEKTVNLTRKFVQLHAEHGDTIVGLAKARLGLRSASLLRPLWYAEPNDPTSWPLSDQFMLGEDLVVAPVLSAGTVQRAVYLPGGIWIDQHGGERQGPGSFQVQAPIEELPYFKRKRT